MRIQILKAWCLISIEAYRPGAIASFSINRGTARAAWGLIHTNIERY